MFFPNCLIETQEGKMKKISSLSIVFSIGLCLGLQTAWAQFPIKIKVPKTKSDPASSQPKQTSPDDDRSGSRSDAATTTGAGKPSGSGASRIYVDLHPTSKLLWVKDSIRIQAKTHDEYWKLPNERKYSSWAPTLGFDLFYDNKTDVNYVAEYLNPDGSSWFTEALDHSSYDPAPETGTVHYQSKDTFNNLQTKSTAAIGTYGVKIKNRDTGEVVFQGKFKVNKFHWDDNPQDKSKFDFFVEHDWLLPIGYVGFNENTGFDFGAKPIDVSVWLKGNINRADLEARVFFNGRQIATTANDGGVVNRTEEIGTEHSIYTTDIHDWKLWHFEWTKTLIYDNGGEFNHANYPDAFFADKNPGDYVVKIYRKGVQVRELKFSIGPDSRLVDGGYQKPMTLTEYKVIVPVKVIGAAEKWNATAWQTDAFYGNPLTGFAVP
jgi:hypothetical protein